ncbi:MAG TPA: hypothetical protein VM012_03860 [Flavitalea sp.]|nr:hypothetical protein [Flavitalea sp.]
MIIALAGRRIDPAGQETARFPSKFSGTVKRMLSDIFLSLHASTLICSAADGTDILALEVADELKMELKVILPFHKNKFLQTSVMKEWHDRFEIIVSKVESANQLVITHYEETDPDVYKKINTDILTSAIECFEYKKKNGLVRVESSLRDGITAVVAWEGKRKWENDITYHFMCEAKLMDIPILEVNTLGNTSLETQKQ